MRRIFPTIATNGVRALALSSVSPYLLQPTRSLDETRKEIEAKLSADRDSK